MVKTKKNPDVNLAHLKSKYQLAFRIDNRTIDAKVNEMFISCFQNDWTRFLDLLIDARESK